MDFIDLLPVFMFLTLAVLIFSGIPVAFLLGGIAILFGFIGIHFGVFAEVEFFNLVPRIWGTIAENLLLVAVPMFVYMGLMLERAGIAADLLNSCQVLLRRVPGGLALSVTLLGTIMAATTGIIGASVVMLTMLAFPMLLKRGYDPSLSAGAIASAGTLGILIPPSIMLVVMASLLSISAGKLFLAAIIPGLVLAGLYAIYTVIFATLRPQVAPPLPRDFGPQDWRELVAMMVRGFLPAVFLIALVLGSIFTGFATPTEAAGVGAVGATLLAAMKRVLTREVLVDVMRRTVLTGGLVYGIFVGATAFAYVFRSLGGDDLIIDGMDAIGGGGWGMLFVIMLVVFLLGFFFDWIEIVLIILPIFAPIIMLMDFGGHVAASQQIFWVTMLIAMNLQTSFLTPPFGFALFFVKGAAPPSVELRQIYKGIIPFVFLQLIALGLMMAFPGLALWLL